MNEASVAPDTVSSGDLYSGIFEMLSSVSENSAVQDSEYHTETVQILEKLNTEIGGVNGRLSVLISFVVIAVIWVLIKEVKNFFNSMF